MNCADAFLILRTMEQALDNLIAERQVQFNAVLQEFKIIPEMSNIATIKKGIRQGGSRFEIALIRALSRPNGFSNTDTATLEGPPPPPGAFINDDGVTVVPGANGVNFWSWVNNILGAANATGDTIAKLRRDITGSYSPEELQLQAQIESKKAGQTRILTIGAIAAVVVIVLILIFKK